MMSSERKFNRSKLDYFYSPQEKSEALSNKNHSRDKKPEGQQRSSSVVKMLDALRLSSYDANRKSIGNHKVVIPCFTGSETDLKDMIVLGRKTTIDKEKEDKVPDEKEYRSITKSSRLCLEKSLPFDDSTDLYSDSRSQSSDVSRESETQSFKTTSSLSDNLYIYQQIVPYDSNSPSRFNTITVHTASGFTIDLDVEVTKTVVMLMKIILWLRQHYPNGSFLCQRLPIESRLLSFSFNSFGNSSSDESLLSQNTLRPPKSRKRISFAPNTLLFSAVSEKSYQEAKEILESYCDIDVNLQTPSGQTLIHIAAGNADLKCIQLLLEHGANPNIKDSHGWGPLHAAIRRGKWKCAILLIESGANFAEYATSRIKEYKEVLSMSRTCYRSNEIFV